uniref:ZFPL1-like B-box zinc-binding domain-containing protein n=1 Tax=Oryza glumipatula TaxID=40148 RepID=A0A0D9YMX6_9ORYZ
MAPAYGRRLASRGGSGNHALPSARSGGRAGAVRGPPPMSTARRPPRRHLIFSFSPHPERSIHSPSPQAIPRFPFAIRTQLPSKIRFPNHCSMGAKGMGTWLFLLDGDLWVEPWRRILETKSRGAAAGPEKATRVYCFVHKVPVCGECIRFPEHQLCVENYRHSIMDSDPPSVMTAISSLQPGSDRKQTVIVIM